MPTLREQLLGSPQTSQTEAAASLLSQRGSQATSSDSGPRVESMAEKAQVMANQAALDAIKQQGQIQQQAVQQQQVETQRKEEQAGWQLGREEADKTDRISFQTDALLDEAERRGRGLDLDRDRSILETAMAGLRLQNQKYVAELQQAGARNRIQSMADAQIGLANEILAKEMQALNFGISTEQMLAMDDDEFRRMLTSMQTEDAKRLADDIAHDNAEKAKWEAAGTIITGGVQTVGGLMKK